MAEEEQIKQDELIDWKEKAEEYLNGWKRAQADYQNREKEIGKEREVLRGFFEESLILEFLPVLDNLKIALSTVGSLASYSKEGSKPTVGSETPYSKGIEQIVKQFEDILKKFGVEKIEVLDKEFDPSVAEAVDTAPSFAKASEGKDGDKVIKVVADGYKKGECVIRPARVIVG